MQLQLSLGFEPSKAMVTNMWRSCTVMMFETLTCHESETLLAELHLVYEPVGVAANVVVSLSVVCFLVTQISKIFPLRFHCQLKILDATKNKDTPIGAGNS
jgi:hypothetical protein